MVDDSSTALPLHGVWRGLDPPVPALATGFAALDSVLPSRGWPRDGVIQIIAEAWGIGELRLLVPLIQRLAHQGRRTAWIGPPYLPYAPALAKAGVQLESLVVVPLERGRQAALWCMERLLRTASCGMAMAWPSAVSGLAMRRLQLAARAGGSIGVVFHTQGDARRSPAPVTLRLAVHATPAGLQIEVLKARGGCRQSTLLVGL